MRLHDRTERLLVLIKVSQPVTDCIFQGNTRMVDVVGEMVRLVLIVIVVVFSLKFLGI